MEIQKNTIKKLASVLEKEGDVELAFLFGSASTGRLTKESDLDIAIWLSKPSYRRHIAIWNLLEDAVQRDVDLVDLRSANPQIAWSALRGRSLVMRNQNLFLRLVLERSREAEDFSEWSFDLWRLRQSLQRTA